MGIPTKWLFLVMLVVLNNSSIFVVRWSRTMTAAGPRYLNTTAVFFAEVLKLCCSFCFLSFRKGGAQAAIMHASEQTCFTELAKITMPGILYTVQNNLVYVSLSNLSGAVHQCTFQLRILATAVLSVAILGKRMSATQWAALIVLTCGVALVQLPRRVPVDSTLVFDEGNAFKGFIAVLSACVLSGLAGVCTERILKRTDASFWLTNFQFAICSSVMGLLVALWQDGDRIRVDGFTQGYSSLVWFSVFLQALSGLLSGAVTMYADSILKCVGVAISIPISCLISAVFLREFAPDKRFHLGVVLVLAATCIYILGVPDSMRSRWDRQHGRFRRCMLGSMSGYKFQTVPLQVVYADHAQP